MVCAGNCMSEFMGLITGTYEAKVRVPKCLSLLKYLNTMHLVY